MKMVCELFDVKYGHNYELCHLEEDPNGIPFVSRTSANNGVSARVKHTGEAPTPAGALTVALGGSVLSTFLQPVPCYEGRDVATLIPKHPMTDEEKLWYACAIRANRYRYSYGRQANRELPRIVLPPPPAWVRTRRIPDFSWIADAVAHPAPFPKARLVRLSDIFDIHNGIPATSLYVFNEDAEGRIPLRCPSNSYEGTLAGFVEGAGVLKNKVFPAETLMVGTDGEGSHTFSYVMAREFVPNSNVVALVPKQTLTLAEKIFYSKAISANRPLFSYGRKPKGERLARILVPEPTAGMEAFILGCRYSVALKKNSHA